MKLALGNGPAAGLVFRMSSDMENPPLDDCFHCVLLGEIPGRAARDFFWGVVVFFVGFGARGEIWGA